MNREQFAAFIRKPSTRPILRAMVAANAKADAHMTSESQSDVRDLLRDVVASLETATLDADDWCVVWATLRHGAHMAERRVLSLNREKKGVAHV